jgi:NADPH-dependent 7-cyano-7-deazaguanine reductase QueF
VKPREHGCGGRVHNERADRDKEIFAEDLAATLLKDLVGACDPQEMTVDLTQQVRGGLQIRTVVRQRRAE